MVSIVQASDFNMITSLPIRSNDVNLNGRIPNGIALTMSPMVCGDE